MFGRIKLRQADTLFSRYLRLKIGHCEVCGRKGEGDDGIKGLCVSHYFGRRSESTRFSESNCVICCSGCHRKFHERPSDYTAFMKKRLGEKGYKLLTLAANQYKKKDDKLVLIYFKKLLKDLK